MITENGIKYGKVWPKTGRHEWKEFPVPPFGTRKIKSLRKCRTLETQHGVLDCGIGDGKDKWRV
jgi:hypothetical protein